MAGGLVALLDDIAALAKLAAASVDDVGAAAGRASVKAAGVVVDDTAVTPNYVHGLAAERELPIIRRIAVGSLRNKLLFILPAALVLSEFVPVLVEIILMCGGAYLCFEGAEKIHHRFSHNHAPGDHDGVPAAVLGPEAEEETIRGAIRTDFILSGEIMVIALKEVIDEGLLSRAIILMVVAVVITIVVYGVVALIVKMDDVGLQMVASGRPSAERVGKALVRAMPKLLALLSVVGTSVTALIVIIALLDSTRVYRLSRAVAMDIAVMEYVEAARLRGEKIWWLMRQEILPNAMPPLVAEFGLRFCFVFLFIAALSFLGLGIQPSHGGLGRDGTGKCGRHYIRYFHSIMAGGRHRIFDSGC